MLPIKPVTYPRSLWGQSNGKLDLALLQIVPGLANGPSVRMLAVAMRGWRALCDAAARAGFILEITSFYDSYRLYAIQEQIFKERYTTTYLAGRPRKWWEGQYWYQLPGTATAATPGMSNHGWGLANDIASATGAKLDWLIAHELEYGFSHELESEPWHIRWYVGDLIPPAVLAYEEGLRIMRTLIIAKDTIGRHWLGDGIWRRIVPEDEVADTVYTLNAASRFAQPTTLASIETYATIGVLGVPVSVVGLSASEVEVIVGDAINQTQLRYAPHTPVSTGSVASP